MEGDAKIRVENENTAVICRHNHALFTFLINQKERVKLCIKGSENSESLMFSESEKHVEAPTGILPYFAVIKGILNATLPSNNIYRKTTFSNALQLFVKARIVCIFLVYMKY